MNLNTGKTVKVGEYVRGLAQLEADERDRLANFSAKAIAAGLAERQVRLAERQGALISEVLTKGIDLVGLTPEQRRLAPEAIRQALAITA